MIVCTSSISAGLDNDAITSKALASCGKQTIKVTRSDTLIACKTNIIYFSRSTKYVDKC